MVDVDKINKILEGIEKLFKVVDPALSELLFVLSDTLCHYAVEAGVPQDEFLKLIAQNYREVKTVKDQESVKIKEPNKIQEVIVK